MQYEMAELIPLVRALTEKYTGKASTSVTYETAQQLMGAILYCLEQAGEESTGELMLLERLTAEEAYKEGVKAVLEKTRAAQGLYVRLMESFDGYGQPAYEETLRKTIPTFFMWYDVRFYPQQEVFLPYPVALQQTESRGIHQVYDYLRCIEAEQEFLQCLPPDYVQEVLWAYSGDYREEVVNIAGIVLKKILLHLLLGIPLDPIRRSEEAERKLAELVRSMSSNHLQENLQELLNRFLIRQCQGHESLGNYLRNYVTELTAELIQGAENGWLDQMV
ncbi:hypothetical protein Ami103574_07640 [Aminipila butyrica]|uniref:Uncharacterized protein n=1 Tax=Aminipila butyrica TaxID=433296 RepID=A0A858BUZ1_9FIRM|nr:DUF6179 domain-containing protein [Aminipila butyrica]QIB69202.1 hypothetical protein Ami103574_07640 [Aminipila butyrica]